MNPLWRKHPRPVETPAPERLDPPGLIYTDKDKTARMWAVIDDLHGRVAKLEQLVHDMHRPADTEAPDAPRRPRRLLGGAR